MQFTLTIDLDDVASSTGWQVSRLLRAVADHIATHQMADLQGPSHAIRVTGQQVGHWEVRETK